MTRADALALLGLIEGFDANELKRARRAALIENHPDHGGSRDAMHAVELAFALLGNQPDDASIRVSRGSDRPSFTVDALPVEAYELLLLAAAELGDVADDDPPYRLEVRLHEPQDTWVRLEVVPDAGSSTVSLFVEGRIAVEMETVRDTWVATINGLRPL